MMVIYYWVNLVSFLSQVQIYVLLQLMCKTCSNAYKHRGMNHFNIYY